MKIAKSGKFKGPKIWWLYLYLSNIICYLPIFPKMPREATTVRRTPSTHHLNMESGLREEVEEGMMMVVTDIRGELVMPMIYISRYCFLKFQINFHHILSFITKVCKKQHLHTCIVTENDSLDTELSCPNWANSVQTSVFKGSSSQQEETGLWSASHIMLVLLVLLTMGFQNFTNQPSFLFCSRWCQD